MTVASYRMGPGTLKFGAGGINDFSCQVRSCEVKPSVKSRTNEELPMLCGEVLPEEEIVSYDWTLEVTFLQDLAAAGVLAWSWSSANTQTPFEFIPNTAAARKVTGTVRVDPLAVGGEAEKRPTSQGVFKVIGTPVMANV